MKPLTRAFQRALTRLARGTVKKLFPRWYGVWAGDRPDLGCLRFQRRVTASFAELAPYNVGTKCTH